MDSKITALTELTTPASGDVLAIVDDPGGSPVTKKVEVDSLDDYLSASTKTLTNKTLTSPKLNEDVALTSTSTELNALDAKTGAWSTSTPTVVATNGTITTLGTCTTRYIQIGKIVFINMSLTITTNGTGADAIRATLPVNAKGTTYCAGRNETTGGEMLSVGLSAGYAYIRKYDNAYPANDGARLIFGGTYEAA